MWVTEGMLGCGGGADTGSKARIPTCGNTNFIAVMTMLQNASHSYVSVKNLFCLMVFQPCVVILGNHHSFCLQFRLYYPIICNQSFDCTKVMSCMVRFISI